MAALNGHPIIGRPVVSAGRRELPFAFQVFDSSTSWRRHSRFRNALVSTAQGVRANLAHCLQR
jgi:hypothetical protein